MRISQRVLTCSRMQFFSSSLNCLDCKSHYPEDAVVCGSSVRVSFPTATLVLFRSQKKKKKRLLCAPALWLAFFFFFSSCALHLMLLRLSAPVGLYRGWDWTSVVYLGKFHSERFHWLRGWLRCSPARWDVPRPPLITLRKMLPREQRGRRWLRADTHIVRIPGLCSLCAQAEAPTGDAWKHPSQHTVITPPAYGHLPFLCFFLSESTFDLGVFVIRRNGDQAERDLKCFTEEHAIC